MRTTYRLMGLADFITLGNALFGSTAILFLILAVNDLNQPYQDGIRNWYIWAAQLCIIISMIGDAIDGPVARRYSKRQILGGSLDIMSDSLSFAVAPSLLIFVMYGRMGEATPLWTVILGLSCCWLVATGMLRLARFEHDQGSNYPWFHGLSSPANAVFLLSLSSLIWLQPSTGIGPGLSIWDCSLCYGQGEGKPWFDFLIVPAMLISGGLMISDRRLSKLKKGIPMMLSVFGLSSLLIGTILQLRHTAGGVGYMEEAVGISALVLFGITFLFSCIYILAGPRLCDDLEDHPSIEEE